MTPVVCCVDMGTSRIKAGLLDDQGRLLCLGSEDAPPCTTWEGFLSFDPVAYMDAVSRSIRTAQDRAPSGAGRPQALILTNQRATILGAADSGEPLTPALSWQDVSAQDAMADFAAGFGADVFSRTTGLPPSALWSLGKILRLRRVRRDLFNRIERFVLLHDYVLRQMGAREWLTDPSNAAVTGLLDIHRLDWSPAILAPCGLLASRLSQIRAPGTEAGRLDRGAAERTGLPEGTPLMVGGGDQQCSALGTGALDSGMAALCLGTAAVLSCPIAAPRADTQGQFFCTAHVVPGRWVLEGIHNAFAACPHWLRPIMGAERDADLLEVARSVQPGAAGLTFLPFLAGIGSPDYDSKTGGAFLGLALSHTRAHMARAVYEGILYEVRRILDAMEVFAPVAGLRVSGGLAGTEVEQMLADITGRTVAVSDCSETSLLGAAALAWRGLGRFRSVDQAAAGMITCADRSVVPRAVEAYASGYRRYRAGVQQVRVWHGKPG